MKTAAILVICLLFLPWGVTQAQIPDNELARIGDPVKGNPIWRDYMIRLLASSFPEDRAFIEKMTVVVLPCNNIQAGTSVGDNSDSHAEIFICFGLIQILDDEDEYVAVLAHEFGHIKLKHQPSYYDAVVRRMPGELDINDASESEELRPEPGMHVFIKVRVPDYEVMAKQEPEADLFSSETLHKNKRDPCAMLRILEKLSKLDGNWYKENPDEYDLIGRKRIKAIAKKECSTPPKN